MMVDGGRSTWSISILKYIQLVVDTIFLRLMNKYTVVYVWHSNQHIYNWTQS